MLDRVEKIRINSRCKHDMKSADPGRTKLNSPHYISTASLPSSSIVLGLRRVLVWISRLCILFISVLFVNYKCHSLYVTYAYRLLLCIRTVSLIHSYYCQRKVPNRSVLPNSCHNFSTCPPSSSQYTCVVSCLFIPPSKNRT